MCIRDRFEDVERIIHENERAKNAVAGIRQAALFTHLMFILYTYTHVSPYFDDHSRYQSSPPRYFYLSRRLLLPKARYTINLSVADVAFCKMQQQKASQFFLNSPLVRHSKETCAQHDEHHDLFAGKNLSRDDDDVVVVVFSSFLLFEEQTRGCGDERDEGARILLFPQTNSFAI